MVGKPGETGQNSTQFFMFSVLQWVVEPYVSMLCIRQNEQLEADRQVDDPKTQDASSDCKAHQAGAETDHNFCTNNSWYEKPQAFLLFADLN